MAGLVDVVINIFFTLKTVLLSRESGKQPCWLNDKFYSSSSVLHQQNIESFSIKPTYQSLALKFYLFLSPSAFFPLPWHGES